MVLPLVTTICWFLVVMMGDEMLEGVVVMVTTLGTAASVLMI